MGVLNAILLAAYVSLMRVRSRMIRGIYYHPESNKMTLALYNPTVGTKKLQIQPKDLQTKEILAKNNQVEKRLVPTGNNKSLSSYKWFGQPTENQWQGYDIFKHWNK